MILGALHDAGGRRYLAKQAKESPSAFLTLVGKLVPQEMKAELTGKDGLPLPPAIYIGQALAIMLGQADNPPQNDNNKSLPRSDADSERLPVVVDPD